jgi:hypothetical protein
VSQVLLGEEGIVEALFNSAGEILLKITPGQSAFATLARSSPGSTRKGTGVRSRPMSRTPHCRSFSL